jgi:hypothetical protein
MLYEEVYKLRTYLGTPKVKFNVQIKEGVAAGKDILQCGTWPLNCHSKHGSIVTSTIQPLATGYDTLSS